MGFLLAGAGRIAVCERHAQHNPPRDAAAARTGLAESRVGATRHGHNDDQQFVSVLGCGHRDGEVVLTVSDDGIGLAATSTGSTG
jgi:anti-sigma regulatory factor (Ser/Thr protein kinase)